jgi:hypothetical protein
VDEYVDKRKILNIIPVSKTKTHYNRLVLSHLYSVTLKRGWTLELVSFKHDEEELVEVMQNLDQYATNPFRYATSYKSIDKLVDDLPYRAEVAGVVDLPTRLMRYGSWGLDFPNL